MALIPSGFFQQLTLAGQCFIGTGPVAGVAIPISTSTTARFALWNPAGSGVNLVLNTLTVDKIDAGAPGVGGLALSYVLSAGSAAATGSPVATFTALTPLNALVGGGLTSRAKFASAATGTTLTTAGTTFYWLGNSREVVTLTVGPAIVIYNFLGSVAIAPGTFVHLIASAADTQVSMPTLTWAEVPV